MDSQELARLIALELRRIEAEERQAAEEDYQRRCLSDSDRKQVESVGT